MVGHLDRSPARRTFVALDRVSRTVVGARSIRFESARGKLENLDLSFSGKGEWLALAETPEDDVCVLRVLDTRTWAVACSIDTGRSKLDGSPDP